MKKFIGILCVILIVGVIVFRIVSTTNEEEIVETEIEAVNVSVELPNKGTLADYTTITGNISSEKMVQILPTMPALVEGVYVEVGDYVEVDQLLFELDKSSIETQITQAEAGVNTAEAGVDQGNVGVQNAYETLAQAELAYEMAQTNYDMNYEQYEFAVNNLAKYEELYNEGIVSETEFEQMKLQASDSTLVLLEQQLLQAEQSLSQAQLGVDAALASSRQAQAGLDQATDGVEQANDALDDMIFLAPISGYITGINVTEDAYASNAQAAMTIETMSKVLLNISVTENVINKIAKGDSVEVAIESIGETSFEGVIKTISPSSNPMTLLYDVTVEINNEDIIIKPGMFANAKLKIAEVSNALYVKSNAIVIEHNKTYLYIINEDGVQEKREVVTGLDTGLVTEIVSGLSVDEEYITSGVGFVDEDTLINVVRGDE